MAKLGYMATAKLALHSLAKATKEKRQYDEEFYFGLQMVGTMGGWLSGSLVAIYAVDYLSEGEGMRQLLLLNNFNVLKEEFDIANQYAASKQTDQPAAFFGIGDRSLQEIGRMSRH